MLSNQNTKPNEADEVSEEDLQAAADMYDALVKSSQGKG
jgi:hypothetical protein